MSRQDTIGKCATTVFTDSDGATCVKYHQTIVFKLSADRKTVTLDHGGWKTNTTKNRINQAFRQMVSRDRFYYVHQVKGEWYLGQYLGNGEHVSHGAFRRVVEV